MSSIRRTLAPVAALALTAGGVVLGAGSAHAAAPTAADTTAASCSQAYLPLPDPACTPGATNPDVTQDTIYDTICVSGWTRTVRPPASYTTALKIQQIADYGYADTSTASYEEDHLIPLELGGAPSDPNNLWPQPRYDTGTGVTASTKDSIENKLKYAVCNGQVQLVDAQNAIATNWTTALRTLGLG